MNLRPSRSRNNLVDPKLYRRKWREVRHAVVRGELADRDAVNQVLESSLVEGYEEAQKEIAETNPFSSAIFHSIQFTGRQLVKYRSSVFEDMKSLRALLKNTEDAEVKAVLDRLDFSRFGKEQRFFYPFEVQILDAENYEEAESGRASHAAYKAAQTQMAMRRVLGHLLPQGESAPHS
jgi:uncharacterized protein (TIGR04562 family)